MEIGTIADMPLAEQREIFQSRQKQIVGDTEKLSVLILGVGGVGSNWADLSASIGVRDIWLLDNDTVQLENIAPGNFPGCNLDDPKVSAVARHLAMNYPGSGVEVTPIYADLYDALNNDHPDSQILRNRGEKGWDVIAACTDAIDSRRFAWNSLQSKCRWWVDGRMGGRGAVAIVVDMEDPESIMNYDQNAFVEPSEPLPCGLKSTAGITGGYLKGFFWEILMAVANNEQPMQQYVLSDSGDVLRIA